MRNFISFRCVPITCSLANRGSNVILLFATLCLIFMYVFWMILIPPFQVPDENSHYFKATTLPLVDIQDGKYGHAANSSVDDLIKTSQFTVIATHPNNKFDINKWLEQPVALTDKTTFFPSALPYTFMPYIGAGVAYKIGVLFNLDVKITFYLMRFFGVLFFFGIVFLAYKNSKDITVFLLPILAFPMIVNQVIGISSDGFSIAAAILLVAVVKGFEKDRRLSSISILLATFFMLNAKLTYYPFLFILVYVVYRERSLHTRKFFAALIAIIFLAIALQYYYMTSKTVNLDHPVERAVDSAAQLSYIIHHPDSYLNTVITTLSSMKDDYLNSFIGNVGWLDTPMDENLQNKYYWGIGALILFYCFAGRWMTKSFLVLVGGLGLVVIPSVALVFTSMYLFWSPVGASIILGVQGRYLIPIFIIFAALPLIASKFAETKKVYPFSNIVISLFVLTFLLMDARYIVNTIIPRFYG